MLLLQALQLTTGILRSRSSSLQLGQQTSPRLVFSTASMEVQRLTCFLLAFLSQCVFFFCFHNKKCSKPNQVCKFNHIEKWDKISAEVQAKILAHCHSSYGKKVWLDADTFAKHRATIPDKFSHLLANSKGPKSA